VIGIGIGENRGALSGKPPQMTIASQTFPIFCYKLIQYYKNKALATPNPKRYLRL